MIYEFQYLTRDRLPLRIAIDLLISRVDQLCEFICENGLSPPCTVPEKDAALKEILNALGPAKSSPAAEKVSGSEQELSPILSNDPKVNTARSKITMGPPPIPASIALSKISPANSPSDPTAEALMPTTSNTSPLSGIQVEQGQSTQSADTPESILSNWDMGLAFGGSAVPAPTDLQQLIESTSERDSLGLDLDGMPQPAGNDMAGVTASTASDDESTLVEDHDTTADIEGLIDDLSDRVGTLRIGRGGKTHFFGPTSTFNLRDMPHSDNFDSHRRIHGYDLHNPDRVEADREVPSELEEHLINLYFSWQDPSFHVVDRKLYEDAKEKWFAMEDTSLYSEALRNAM